MSSIRPRTVALAAVATLVVVSASLMHVFVTPAYAMEDFCCCDIGNDCQYTTVWKSWCTHGWTCNHNWGPNRTCTELDHCL
jgi:hypothetical protein